MAIKKDSRLKRAGVSAFNKPKRTPKHKTKSHVVVAKEGSKVKTIRFGQQGAKTAGKPKKSDSKQMKLKRKSFKARHAKNIDIIKKDLEYKADKKDVNADRNLITYKLDIIMQDIEEIKQTLKERK